MAPELANGGAHFMIGCFNRARKRMSCRYYLSSLMLVLLIGVGFYLLLLAPLQNFIKTVTHDSMRAVAGDIDLICEQNYSSLMRAGVLSDGPGLRVQQAITLSLIEEHARSHQMLVQVFAGPRPMLEINERLRVQTPILAQSLLDPELLSELAAVGKVRLITKGNNEYYATRITFSPWDWQIVVLKDSDYYQWALQRLHNAYYVTIALLLLLVAMVFFFFRYQIEKPINELVSSLERGEKPTYRGVYEFEFLSDRLRETLQEQEIMRRRFFEQQKLESVGILAGGIAHDFNNLLAALYGQISLAALELPPGHPSVKPLRLAEKSADRARALTAQLLTFASGGRLNRRSQDIAGLIEEVALFVISGPAYRLVLELEKPLWEADIDREQVGNVLHNLLLNAKEAMPEGGLVRLGCANETLAADSGLPLPAGRYLRIKISDNGQGMTPEVTSKIFDPYFSTKTRDFNKGTGLGLSICRSVIISHGGHIEVASRLGFGTTFTIYLPVAQSDKQQ